jgi:class 3 adenylate cyclase
LSRLSLARASCSSRCSRHQGGGGDHRGRLSRRHRVLFADIVGFTPLSERLSARELVALLDRVFARWDALAARHGVEKIKTIGDAYMVAGGIPLPRADHAEAIAEMALAMQPEAASCAGETRLPGRCGSASIPARS